MHELSICGGLLRAIAAVATVHNASGVRRAVLSVGPLSCVDPDLLTRAFMAGRAGTLAEHAVLQIEGTRVQVRCETCGLFSDAAQSVLRCRSCGSADVRLVSGNELLLTRVDLEFPETERN